MITNFNFPDRFKHAHLAKLEFPDHVIEKINNWIKNPKHFLVFLGNAGIGKTYTCHAIANYLLEKKRYFRLTNENDFFSMLKKVMGIPYWEVFDELKRLCETEFFFFNDMGSGRPDDITDWQKEQVFNFIDVRYETMLPTVITSNHFMKDIKEIYPERVHSRLMASENTVIELNWHDKRQQGL